MARPQSERFAAESRMVDSDEVRKREVHAVDGITGVGSEFRVWGFRVHGLRLWGCGEEVFLIVCTRAFEFKGFGALGLRAQERLIAQRQQTSS